MVIVIRYKSGHKVKLRCKTFSGRTDGEGVLRGMEWELGRFSRYFKSPLHIGINDVESIYQRRWF